jgi:hypothetical protein
VHDEDVVDGDASNKLNSLLLQGLGVGDIADKVIDANINSMHNGSKWHWQLASANRVESAEQPKMTLS